MKEMPTKEIYPASTREEAVSILFNGLVVFDVDKPYFLPESTRDMLARYVGEEVRL